MNFFCFVLLSALLYVIVHYHRWLYVAILQLTDERVPPEVSRVSQQELIFIAEFLSGFDKTVSTVDGRATVNLEKLGQYLRREDLQTPLTPEGSEWAAMLNTNNCLHNHAHIVKQDFNLSLLQSHAKLVTAVQNVFAKAYQGLIDHFTTISTSLPCASLVCSQIVANEDNLLLAMIDADSKFLKLCNVEYVSAEPASLSSEVITINVDLKHG